MNVLGVTCARGGSKGVPGKNIRNLAGKPLIAWTIEEALRAVSLDRYVVSTDSVEIAEVARRYGAYVVMRPRELAADRTPIVEAVAHAVEFCEAQDTSDYDVVADLRCTNPFKMAEDIDAAVREHIRTGADWVIGVSKLEDHHPARIKRIVGGRLLEFSWPEPPGGCRQDLVPDAYIRNGSIYVVSRAAIMEGVSFSPEGEYNIRPYIMPAEKSLNIDTELDFILAEALMRHRNGSRE